MTRRYWPKGCVDHIDGDALNNSPENLRVSTITQLTDWLNPVAVVDQLNTVRKTDELQPVPDLPARPD
jgi:hypothetical protein